MNRLIAVTGGMASGKTTLCQRIMKDNPDFVYIDVDTFRRGLYANDEYVKDLKKVLPALKEKEINSLNLNKIIYQNEEDMKKYKQVLYRYLFAYMATFEDKTIIVDWALIIQDDLIDKFDKVIYLDISEEERLKRLKDSDLTEEEILKRFSLQRIDIEKYRSNKLLIIKDLIDMQDINKFIKTMDCKFTLPNDGGKAIWEITHNCNYGCSYCIFSCNLQKVSNELTTEECYHVIDELVKNGFKYLKITGGEPFLRPDIIDILRYASKRMVTDISTNASLITPKKVEQLNELDLKMIHVSLDGNKLEHEKVRGNNTYDRTIRGLNALKKSKNYIRIGSVIHKNNEKNLDSLVKDASSLGADEIIFSIMEPIEGQDRSQFKTLSNDALIKDITSLKDKYQDMIKVNYNFGEQPNYVTRCPAGDKFIYINNYGRVSPCTWVYERDKTCISTKSLKDTSLEEILDEEQLKRFKCHKKEGICYGKI